MKKLIFLAAFLGIVGLAQGASAQSHTFNSDLKVGSSGADVVALQNLLISSGYDIPYVSSGLTPRGYFGMQTRSAVMAYQSANGVPATGYVGPLTRGRLNKGGVNPSGFTILYPNGGESIQYGTNYIIRWTPTDLTSAAGVTITLVHDISGCFGAGPNRPCLAVVNPEYVLASNIANTGSYSWALTPSVPGGNTPLVGDNYYIRICRGSSSANSGNCDTSNAAFKIVPGGVVNSKPVINGLDAPTTLRVGQTGAWTVRASDSNNQNLSYSVDWGDTPIYVPREGQAPMTSTNIFLQTSTFTHSYSSVGVYTVTFTVRNAAGQTTQTSSTVTVTDIGTPSGLQVINPNANDILYRNTPYVIRWNSPAYLRATYAIIRLIPQNICPSGYSCLPIAPYVIAADISINQNSYTWNVGSLTQNPVSSAPNGEYIIQICETGTSNCSNSGKFTIGDQNTSLPDINVISPNGGGTWDAGSKGNVTLQISGNSAQIGNLVLISVVDSSNNEYLLRESEVNGAGNQVYSITLPPNLPNGAYRIYAALYSTGVTCAALGCPPAPRTMQAYDYSDNTFIVSGSYPLSCPYGYICTPYVQP